MLVTTLDPLSHILFQRSVLKKTGWDVSLCLRQQAATHYFSTSKAKMHFGWNCIKRRSNKQAREGWRLARIRQMLPARLSETCLSLLSSSDLLCVALTAIKPSSWFLAHMRSQTELLMKYERPFLLGLQSWMCFFSWRSAELFTLTPWIPTVTRFSLGTHHLLTHRLTSLTLQCEGVAASMNHWLVGESSLSSVCVCLRWSLKKKLVCGT